MKFFIESHQKNILIAVVAVILLILLFSIFVYTPKKAQLHRLRQELNSVNDSLNNIQRIVGYTKDLAKGILKLRQEISALESMFIKLDDAGKLLQMLSEQARDLDIEVLSAQPSEFKTSYGKKGEVLEIENLECNKMSIEMDMLGTYKTLTNYIQKLENSLASPRVVVRSFDIQKYQAPRLKVHIVTECFALLPKK